MALKSGDEEENIYRIKIDESRTENISVSTKLFAKKPQKKNTKSIIFIPGWTSSLDREIVTVIGQAFSDEVKGLGLPTYAMISKAENVIPNSLFFEAKAMLLDIYAKGLKEIIIVGNSQGGAKSTNLAYLAQKEGKTKIEMLVLLDSVGLINLNPLSFAIKFAKDSIIDTPLSVIEETVKEAEEEIVDEKKAVKPAIKKAVKDGKASEYFGLGRDFAKGFVGEILSLPRIKNDIKEMSKLNPHLGQIKGKILMIDGVDDPVSDLQKMDPLCDPHKELDNKKLEKYLKENLFKNCESLKVIPIKKLGHHSASLLAYQTVIHSVAKLIRNN